MNQITCDNFTQIRSTGSMQWKMEYGATHGLTAKGNDFFHAREATKLRDTGLSQVD